MSEWPLLLMVGELIIYYVLYFKIEDTGISLSELTERKR